MQDRSGQGLTGARRVIGCAAIACALAGPGTAAAAIGPADVRPGKNVTVFHNIDFVAAFGHRIGEDVQVDVIRDGHRVATALGKAVDTPEGGALEVNHGVETAALPGDCWEGATPDVLPGDLIRVTSDGGVDEVVVDDIDIDSVTRHPGLDLVDGTDDDEVWVEGDARTAGGSPIAIEILDSGEFRDPNPIIKQLRMEPNEVVAGPTEGRYIAKYRAPFRFVKGAGQISTQNALDALLRDGHAFGFGHLPLPDGSLRPDAMLVEGMGGNGGPAAGCEASPARASSAGTVSDDVLNQENTVGLADDAVALTVGGWAAASVTAAEVELTDSEGIARIVPVTGLAEGATRQQGWSAGFTMADVAALQQGVLEARLLVGGTPTGAVKEVLYDVVAPELQVDPAGGSYTGKQRVSVTAMPADMVSYKLGDAAPRTYAAPIELLPGTHTLVLRAEDEAGNATYETHEYEIAAPVVVVTEPKPEPTPEPKPEPEVEPTVVPGVVVPAPAPVVVPARPVLVTPAPVAGIDRLKGPKRVTLAAARRGVRIMVGTEALDIAAKANRGGKLTRARMTATGFTLVFKAKRRGTYTLTVAAPGAASKMITVKVR